jgi:hypothetical protein
MATSSFEISRSACEEKALDMIITVLKTVAWILLVKTENPRVCVTLNCKL